MTNITVRDLIDLVASEVPDPLHSTEAFAKRLW